MSKVNPKEWVPERTILLSYSGSTVYGTSLDHSDEDLRGVCVPPRNYFLGLDRFEQLVVNNDEEDRTVYDIRKWASLALKGNPNILELLWTPENYYKKVTDAGRMLIEHRDLFLTKAAKKPYTGFAYAQLDRMEKLNKNANTNEHRRALVEEFGYDCKAAYHVVRLLRMCFEILTEGTLHVQRHDWRELVAIRRGEWSIERVKEEGERLNNRIDEAMATTDLPAKPDYHKVNELIMDIVSSMI